MRESTEHVVQAEEARLAGKITTRASETFAALRLARGLTLVEVASHFQVSHPTVFDWEKGHKRPERDRWPEIAIWSRDEIAPGEFGPVRIREEDWLTEDELLALLQDRKLERLVVRAVQKVA